MIKEVDQFTKVNVSKINEVIKFCNDMDSEKAEKDDTYTKSQVDSFVSSINSSISSVNSLASSKANSSDVYSKSEVDALVSSNVISYIPANIISFDYILPFGGSWAYICVSIYNVKVGSGKDQVIQRIYGYSSGIAGGGTDLRPNAYQIINCTVFAIRIQ